MKIQTRLLKRFFSVGVLLIANINSAHPAVLRQ